MLLAYLERIQELMLQQLSGRRAVSIFRTAGQSTAFFGTLDLSSGTPETTTWYRTQESGYVYEESETTDFVASGTVITADGTRLSFDVELHMSRSYMEAASSYTQSVDAILTDPLVIQLDHCPPSLSDETFSFDLDQDGVRESIHMLSGQGAFLAYDKNGDGIINDGSELFGTKSGNGFLDLAAYDEDHNGWIDEKDSIYRQLLLWQRDGNGNNHLLTLQEGDIGALYLGAQSTQFSMNSLKDNTTHAVIRSSGIALSNSGQAHTMAQIDFAAIP